MSEQGTLVLEWETDDSIGLVVSVIDPTTDRVLNMFEKEEALELLQKLHTVTD